MSDEQLGVVLEEFLAGHHVPTAAAYRRDLARFLVHLDLEGRAVKSATTGVLARHARALERDGYSSASVARALSAISSFYDHLVREGVLAQSPAVGLRRPARADGPSRLGLSECELRSLVRVATAHSDEACALVLLSASSGCA